MIKAVSFGEINLIISAEDNTTFSSLPEKLNFLIGSSDIYFLQNLSNFGIKTSYISAITKNFLTNSIYKQLNQFKIKTNNIELSSKGRIPIVFQEHYNYSSSKKFIDRKSSLIDKLKFTSYDFKKAFTNCNLYHISGLTPSLSENSMNTVIRSLRLAKEMNLEVFCTLNHITNSWKFIHMFKNADRDKIMSDIASYSDYLSGNIEDIKKIFNLNNNIKDNKDISYYENVLLELSKRFPYTKVIALIITSHINNNSLYFGAIMYLRQANQFYFSPFISNNFKYYLINNIADETGITSAFNAGLYYGIKKFKNPQLSLDFALANAILKYNFKSGYNYCTLNDLKSLMKKLRSKQIYF